jgi:hypothetical protein
MKAYAGVGSRRTPPEVLVEMTNLGKKLADRGWLLRSGGAIGADINFEWGCDEGHGKKEIILPWRRFNGHSSELILPPFGKIRDEAMRLAEKFHPRWINCTQAARCLHARNALQVLGMELDSPVQLVLCWTPHGILAGGTAMAINIARSRDIPVFNLAHLSNKEMDQFTELTGLVIYLPTL